jgi:hypothetical protein
LGKPQPGTVFIHFLGVINNKALEFDDKDAKVWDVLFVGMNQAKSM